MNNVLSLIGIARRAGQLVLGFTGTQIGVNKGRVKLVILAKDAGPHTREKVERLCRRKKVAFYYFADRQCLGRAVGKEAQTVLGITSTELADAIKVRMSSVKTE